MQTACFCSADPLGVRGSATAKNISDATRKSNVETVPDILDFLKRVLRSNPRPTMEKE